MQLTQEQQEIHDSVVDYVASYHRAQKEYIAVAGYAGTGKTTLMGSVASTLVEQFPTMELRFLTPTGKASVVLSNKLRDFGVPIGITGRVHCSTIHSYMYWFRGHNSKTGELHFDNKSDADIDGDLLIIDEASMITPKVFMDLLALNRPMVFVGDSGQLPPVNAPIFQPLLETDLVLQNIHRQAWDNPIIQLATRVRNGEKIEAGNYGGKAAKLPRRSAAGHQLFQQFQRDVFNSTNRVILCGMNKTRVTINKSVRRMAGLTSKYQPEVGERVVCLRNSKTVNMMNGQCGAVSFVSPVKPDILYDLRIIPEDCNNFERSCLAYAKAFNNKRSNELPKLMAQDSEELKDSVPEGECDLFDYGYCMSVHKSQGSEWERVVLLDERMSKMSDENYNRWLYTGVTRAKDKLLILS